MSFLKGLFETKQFVEDTPRAVEATARATGSTNSATYGAFGMGQVGDWDIDKAVNRGLERVVWVFRCIDVLAQNQSMLPIRLRKGADRRHGEYVEDQRLWNLLNVKANPYERAWQFRYRLSANLLLSRRGAFVEVVLGRDGRPSQLHLLPANATYPIPDPLNFVSGYRVHRQDGAVEVLPADRVIWLRLKPHPTDPYSQMTPLMAAGVSVDTDWLVHIFNRNFLANDGRPGLLVSIAGSLNPEDAEEIKRRFRGGPNRAGETTVIEAEDVAVADLSATPRDAQWESLLKMSKEEILMAFGVSESIIGNSSGRTFSNADSERNNFWLDTMPTHCDPIAQGLDPLTGSDTDDMMLAFDYSEVDVYQLVEKQRREDKRQEFLAGLCTVDEYFEAVGREAWDVPATRVLFKQGGGVIAKNDEDKQATADLAGPAGMLGGETPGGVPGLPAGAPDPWLLENPDAVMEKIAGYIVDRVSQEASPERVDRNRVRRTVNRARMIEAKVADAEVVEITEVPKDHPFVTERLHLEGVVEGVVEGWDERQAKVVTERVEHAKFRKGTRHWDSKDAVAGELKSLDPEYAVQTKEWQGEIRDLVGRRVRNAILREARRAARELHEAGVLDRIAQDRGTRNDGGDILLRAFGTRQAANSALEGLYEQVMGIVDNASRSQSRRLGKIVTDLDEQGRTIGTIQRAIRRQIGQRSQWRKALSTNVVTAATEGAREAVMRSAGAYVTKKWNAHKDERVRGSHLLADGQEVDVRAPFVVGGHALMFPGDPTAPPGETVNCRCWLTYSMSAAPIL